MALTNAERQALYRARRNEAAKKWREMEPDDQTSETADAMRKVGKSVADILHNRPSQPGREQQIALAFALRHFSDLVFDHLGRDSADVRKHAADDDWGEIPL